MESRVKLTGHPVHPMLSIFPLGLLVTSLVFDVLFLVSRNTGFAFVSYAIIAGGIVSGLIASAFGIIDWLGVPRATRARAVGLWHGLSSLGVVGLFAGSWSARYLGHGLPTAGAMAFSFGGTALALIAGWLGQELVTRLGVGVDPGANVNAPSSLRREPEAPRPEPLPPRVVPFPRERRT